MGSNSKIEWTDHTWNPWQGCTKVSNGCTHCYMYREKKWRGQDPATVVRSKRPTFNAPLRRSGGRMFWDSGSRIFVCSWSDFFIEEADPWREDAWNIMRQRPGLTFQIPTKRTHRIADCLPGDWGNGWPNVWLLASIEDQDTLDRRLKDLIQVKAVVRGVSAEPLLGPVDFSPYLRRSALTQTCKRCNGEGSITDYSPGKDFDVAICPGCRGSGVDSMWLMNEDGRPPIHWIIAGGESGDNARPMNKKWLLDIRDQCQAAGVAFFFKQWGEWSPVHAPPGELMMRTGRHAAGRMLGGKEWSEFPDGGLPRSHGGTENKSGGYHGA